MNVKPEEAVEGVMEEIWGEVLDLGKSANVVTPRRCCDKRKQGVRKGREQDGGSRKH